jgi:phosphate-selective porin OprO/OprP
MGTGDGEEEYHMKGKRLFICLALFGAAGLLLTLCCGVHAQEDLSLEERVEKIEEKLDKDEAASATDLRVFWKEGLNLESTDKNFKLKIGGRIMNDWAWIDENSDIRDELGIGDQEDGTEFRRARLYTSGTIYGSVDYKLQFDFEGGDADLKDAYLGFKGLPFGYVKVGHFKEPFSLEELTSSKYIEFMERALPVGAFSPSRNTGLQVSSTALEDNVTWAAGVFRDTNGYGEGESEGGYNLTGRITGLPCYEDGGEKLLHLGAAVSFRHPEDDVGFSQRPEIHLADKFVDTPDLVVDDMWVCGVEAALVCGPASVQAEYISADSDRKGASDAEFDGYYIQASYFLTGEHRNYKKSAGSFSRVKPFKNFREDGGWGAWEVAARYSSLDLSDSDIRGGELDDVTLGVNWHLNPNVRIMWNYVSADSDHGGEADLFGMRFQVDF